MKTAYIDRLGNVIVPFNTLHKGEVVIVKSTDGSEIHRLLVISGGSCSTCPYKPTTGARFRCGVLWSDGISPANIMKPLCVPFICGREIFTFKDLDNIMEEL